MLYKPPEMQLKPFTLVFAFQARRSSTKLMAEGHLETEEEETEGGKKCLCNFVCQQKFKTS